MKVAFTFVFLFLFSVSNAQTLSGVISDSLENPIVGVNIYYDSLSGTTTNTNGQFIIKFKESGSYSIRFSHVRYATQVIEVAITSGANLLNVVLNEDKLLLAEINIESNRPDTRGVSVTLINPQSIRNAPLLRPDISAVLATLPSVVSNNELSSTYSVRGGSYDENLVLVNGIKVYRPFLARSGKQEGLSFINIDLIESVSFSAGGWPARLGDKMSSVLETTYKSPDQFHASASLGLLGAAGHLEGSINDGKIGFLAGVRHQRSGYLLNTLDVEGDYTPKFTDFQNLWTFRPNTKTSVEVLLAYSANRYQVVPTTGETTFGTFNKELRLKVAFDGQEQFLYNTYQGAVKLSRSLSNRLDMTTIVSYAYSNEQENIDLEGGYRLCDLDKNQSSDNFNECLVTRGIGTLFNFSRNRLEANLLDIDITAEYRLSETNKLVFGISGSSQKFDDKLNEFSFIDSLDYVTINEAVLANNSTTAHLVRGFIQQEISQKFVSFSYGVRANYNTLNNDLLISPRMRVSYLLPDNQRMRLNFGAGLYQQQPVYREYRDSQGVINTKIKGQSSLHFISGLEYAATWWGRPFELISEIYGKYLWQQIPYTFEDVKIRYLPGFEAKAYAVGFETRVGGEFIVGTESWFSFGISTTKEKINSVDTRYVRRPTDQRIKLAVLFEDHIPWDPTMRVNLNLQYSSGLPFGPPDALTRRNSFDGDSFTRLDVGFTKLLIFKKPHFQQLRIGIAIYNLFGIENAVTYTWIKDINSQQFAVPNNLTGRLVNLTISARF